jgi:hypothetical protein
MTDTNIGNVDATEATTETNTQAEKSYSQREVDDMMARMKSSLSKKLLKPYEELGDPETIREVLTTHQKREQETALKRGEFDKVMSDLASKKDAEIQKRDAIIREFKVEQPLLSLASQYRSVNPEQVKQLLKPAVRLNAEGEVEVIDTKTGSVRYDDSGNPLTVDKYVKEFLDANPHFTSATPATTNTQSNVNNSGSGPIDLKTLDLTRPDHRKIYAEARRNGKI